MFKKQSTNIIKNEIKITAATAKGAFIPKKTTLLQYEFINEKFSPKQGHRNLRTGCESIQSSLMKMCFPLLPYDLKLFLFCLKTRTTECDWKKTQQESARKKIQ